ncbi:hypothetical protein SYNPS1DRAFT_22984 [Syncephalis pseudoplumigaleata]|uniref:Signal recognition particle subunit SRP72 n=1 Tax=Syncephalis pseudoplumigaleata TaxID=1712513 RepID=A0A4P9YY30_9FUNG|nr:hypothetical protein SYNPS1DRAFT_22984 [Syncephalis pseudoplumigaleata]|eukprot:RKP24987.1 hypothetical protein SYNPS1DRAFT_22984 [Syncephalis pseudoplumigaleata]
MATDTDPVRLYADMDAAIADGDYDRVLTCCNQLLEQDAQDADALRAKLVTLIRMDRYHEALKFLDVSMPPAMARERVFERAYCLYRLEKLDEVQALFRTVDVTTSLQLTHLKAQVAYKQEDFAAAIKLYGILLEHAEKDDPNYADLVANSIAAKAAALASGQELSQKMMKQDELETYDQLYNAATFSIANGQLVAAEALLRKAREVCRSSLLEQEYTEDEIQEELATIMAQLAYVNQLLGRTAEAHSIQQKLLDTKLGEKTVLSIVVNNEVALQRPKAKELCASHRRLQLAGDSRIGRKLLLSQRRQMAANRAIMQLRLRKYKSARDMAKRLRAHQPGWSVPYFISAAVPYYQGRKAQAMEELSTVLAQHTALSEVRIVLARMAMHAGDTDKAIALLGECQADQLLDDVPTLALATGIYESAGQLDKARAFHLRTGMPKEAMQDFTLLVKANSDDKEALVNLVLACADHQPALAKDYVGALAAPPIQPGQLSSTELAALEASAPGLKRHGDKSAGPSKPAKAPVKRKKRANPPAKHANPDEAPDPERWLPKRERSDYKPKGRRRGAAGKLATGPQGISLPGSGGGGTGSARIDGKR